MMKHTMKFNFKSLLFALALMWGFSQTAFAGKDPVYTGFLSSEAAGGYDVVSYFSEGKPVEGKDKFQTEYNGADWLFSSQENLDTFLSDPNKYAPQYGGYCAWAAAEGKTYKGDPQYWNITEGKLYLNFDQSIQNRWLADKDNFISKADNRWPDLLK